MTASKLLVKREGDFHYPICFEEDFSNLAQVMKEEGLVDRKICIVTDSNVGPLYEESVKQVLSEVSSDISVLETMLKQEGLMGSEFDQNVTRN